MISRSEGLQAVRGLIAWMGDDPDREGLKETPDRVLRALLEMTAGYGHDPKELFKEFEVRYTGMVIIRSIEFASLCEHHLIPFTGFAHVGYVPSGKVVGLSKFARLVDLFARRLQVQERLTEQITDAIQENLKPIGCGCVIEAKHGCMSCRGVHKSEAVMVTDSLRGSFRDGPVRAEFLSSCFRGK